MEIPVREESKSEGDYASARSSQSYERTYEDLDRRIRKLLDEDFEERKIVASGEDMTHIPHTFTRINCARYDVSRSRLLHCSFCRKLLWELDGPRDLVKEGFVCHLCQACNFVVHPYCVRRVPRNCTAPTEVHVWTHVETGEQSFKVINVPLYACFVKGWIHHSEYAILVDDQGNGYEVNFVNQPKAFIRSLEPPLSTKKIKHVTTGANYTLFLTEDGEVYGSGRNGEGQLGIGQTSEGMIRSPVKVQGFESRVIRLSSGGNHTLVLTEDNNVYCWGDGRNGRLGTGNHDTLYVPTKIPGENFGNEEIKIKNVVCGWSHSLVVVEYSRDSTSALYTFGRGELGQCGHGERKDELVPRVVESLLGKKIVDVSGGYYHSACATSDGEVFCFGFGEEGQCGMGNTDSVFTPRRVEIGERCFKVNCGGFHTVAVTILGRVYIWGGGTPGVGVGKRREVLAPSILGTFAKKQIVSIKGGMFSTIVLTYDSETVKQKLFERDSLSSKREHVKMKKGYAVTAGKEQIHRWLYTQEFSEKYTTENLQLESGVEGVLETMKRLHTKVEKVNIANTRRALLQKSIQAQRQLLKEEQFQLEERKKDGEFAQITRASAEIAEKKKNLENFKIQLENQREEMENSVEIKNNLVRLKMNSLREMFPIVPTQRTEFSICGLPLPKIEFLENFDEISWAKDTRELYARLDREAIAAALGDLALLLAMVSKYLIVPLPYRMLPMGSRSMIVESTSHNILYPLYSVGTKPVEFRLGLFYLHKNIELILSSVGIEVSHPGHALENMDIFFMRICGKNTRGRISAVPLFVQENPGGT